MTFPPQTLSFPRYLASNISNPDASNLKAGGARSQKLRLSASASQTPCSRLSDKQYSRRSASSDRDDHPPTYAPSEHLSPHFPHRRGAAGQAAEFPKRRRCARPNHRVGRLVPELQGTVAYDTRPGRRAAVMIADGGSTAAVPSRSDF